MTFYHAIRDSGPKEGRSDGVTFRVWVGDEQIYERHTDSHKWEPGEVDLVRFAGREILLRLESHPGPKNNTSCDSSFWGDPTIIAGTAPRVLSAAEKQSLAERACGALIAGKDQGDSVFAFDLGAGNRASLALGPNGLADGILAFGAAGRSVWFDGLPNRHFSTSAWEAGRRAWSARSSRRPVIPWGECALCTACGETMRCSIWWPKPGAKGRACE